ncbi:TonB-dependent receptor [Altererythrobacter xixiisoli]|uniref:TonB-dependent receptor n=1 Tax=Croceibacterium xixiisoli TaxID=1476466 RepID=A0A6I4TYX7_9SPHN|nr:TonB-dependent receptor [Croceibacterium xixiisoli]MXO99573.1 TonB-dependent receptor [Croceibacterium xixiisoli]
MIASRVHLAAALLAGTAGIVLPAVEAQAQGQGRTAGQTITIAAQPLDAAIRQLMAQTGVVVSYPADMSAGKRSAAVSGVASPVAALSRLLEGTGLSYRQTGGNSFTLEPAPAAAGNAVQLGTLRVEGSGDSAGAAGTAGDGDNDRAAAAIAPYRTPGSVAHVSREQIDRVPPTSTGDIFLSTPGVISAGNRNGQSLDLNIRGMQGMGRVATLIDGASQQTSMYRGYGGTSSRSFIDPDLIGGIDISKGPSAGAYGAGSMGGVVNMRTLVASDLVGEGNSFGVRVKAGIADNSQEPPAALTRTQRFERGGLTTDARNLSIAAAYRGDVFELVGSFVERRNGNYTAGTVGNDRTSLVSRTGVATEHPISLYGKGGEIFNTSRDTQSVLVKGTARFGNGHALELGYVRYDSVHGEEYPDGNNPFSQWSWIEQAALSDVVSNIYTAKYRWNPAGNDLIDLRAEAYISDVEDFWGAYNLRTESVTKGFDLWNTSLVGTGIGELALRYGGQYSVEDGSTRQDPAPIWGDNMTFDGVRKLGRVYANADLDLNDWARLSGGLSYEFFSTRGDNWRNTEELGLDGSRLNPRASFTLTPTDGIQIFASYSEGWRPATLRETLLDMDTLIRPNPSLRPEKSRNIEYGINVLQDGVLGNDRLQTKLVYFDNRYTDFIMREYGTSFGLETNYRTYTNIPQVHFRGVEASLDYNIGGWFLEGQVNYYTDVQFCAPTGENSFLPCGRFTSGEDYRSEAVPPKYSGAVTLGGRFFDDRLTLGARTVFAGKRAVGRQAVYGGSSVASEWNPYAVFDLFGSLDITDYVTVSASAENIANRFYLDALSRARTPSPGRLVRLSVTGRFGGPDRQRERAELPHQSRLGVFGKDWSGFYLGVASGYADASSDISVVTMAGAATQESKSFDDSGLSHVLLAGYNWQSASGLVLGVEGDFGLNTSKGSTNLISSETTSLANYKSVEAVYRSQNDWHGSLRGRIGQGFGRVLLYATGGLAIRRDDLQRDQFIGSSASPTPTRTAFRFSENDSRTHLGWVAGLGGQFAISDRWSVRGEYLRSDFGSKDYSFADARKGAIMDHVLRQNVLDPETGQYQLVETQVTGSASVVEGRVASRETVTQAIRIGFAYRF